MHRHYQDCFLPHQTKDFTQPAALIFMGHQTSRGSDAEAGTTPSIHSHQALHHAPNRSVHSREHLPSGLLKDFRLGGEDAASHRAHLSDDISCSNDPPDGCNLSDKHETTMARPPSARALTGAAGEAVPCGGDDEQGPSPLVTLTGPEKNLSPDSSSPLKAKNSLAEHTESGEVAHHQPPTTEDGERGVGHLIPHTSAGKEAEDTAGLRRISLPIAVQFLLRVSTETDCQTFSILPLRRVKRGQVIFCCVFVQVEVRVSAQQALTRARQRAPPVTCPYLLHNLSRRRRRICHMVWHLRRVPLLQGVLLTLCTVLNHPSTLVGPTTHDC